MATDIKSGDTGSANVVMNMIGSQFNDTAQMIFNADYIGFDSRLTNSTTPDLKNVLYSTFTSDDADTNYGFIYDASTDLYQTLDIDAETEYIIIEADDAVVSWTGNGTNLMKVVSGKWFFYGTSGTDAAKRAQLHKSLWYGTNGSNALIDDFSNVTAVKTSHANDVGKRAVFVQYSYSGTGAFQQTGTFNDTSTNTNCASWSNLTASVGTSNGIQWENPSSTVLNVATESSSVDEIGTDRAADEKNNPATCQIQRNGANANTGDGEVVILCVGTISWAGTMTEDIRIDYTADNSIPLMTAVGSDAAEGLTTSTLIFKDTIVSTDNTIPVINTTIDATSSQQISVSANGGSNYTDVNNAEIARPTAGTALWRRIVITRTDLSKLDKVTEQAVKYEFY